MAERFEIALVALGLAGDADFAAMVDDLVREADPAILRENVHQLLFDFLRGVALGQAEPMADAEDVRVDNYAFGLAEADSENYVGGFAGCAGDGDELGKSLRNFAVEFFGDGFGCALN